MRDRLFRSCDCTSGKVDGTGLRGALYDGQSQVSKLSGMELTVLRHLINSCGVPGWTGTKKRHTTMNVDAIHTDNSTALHGTNMGIRASGAGVYDAAEKPANGDLRLTGVWNRTAFRHTYPNALFNKSPLQLRRIGALGGKAYARNQRARRASMPTPPPATPLGSAPRQSTAEAVAALDALFRWLRCAEKRRSLKLSPTRTNCRTARISK